MADQRIRTKIKCTNIAPLISLSEELESNSLKIGVFASNGSGKTFLSRLFRLIEKRKSDSDIDENTTDKLLTLGEDKGAFQFKIINKAGVSVEDISLKINRGKKTVIPESNYIYHVFNEDYIQENLRDLDYDRESDIQGFILGKSNIDLSDDEAILEQKREEGKELSKKIDDSIRNHIEDKVNGIKDIKRLSEYKDYLNKERIIDTVGNQLLDISSDKDYGELIKDFDKIKSVPENLETVEKISELEPFEELTDEIFTECNTEYSLSTFSKRFKDKIVSKRSFIENGLTLVKDETCPFCEQDLEEKAIELINNYSQFLEDSEAKTYRKLEEFQDKLDFARRAYESVKNENISSKARFDEYKHKYISSLSEVELHDVNSPDLDQTITQLKQAVEEKKKDITYAFEVSHSVIEASKKEVGKINRQIEENNKSIEDLNYKTENVNHESKAIRKNICKRVFNDLVIDHDEDVRNLRKLRQEYQNLRDDIEKKKEGIKISKRKKVSETIKKILTYFFADKYILDEETFRLTFNKKLLDERQAKDILSTGEKSLLAFAYFIGDTHLLVEKQEDYNNLFFIIDDPISSMDFTHVYTVCGLIRDIDKIIPGISQKRIFVFSHNSDFMRIVSSNSIIEMTYLLKESTLKKFNENLTVPYIYHLIDVYSISEKKSLPNHTSANSIRHILETLTKFENINMRKHNIASYVENNIDKSERTYTLIQDLSHGAWRSEQSPIDESDYVNICTTIIDHINKKFPGQIEYCKEMVT